MNPVHRFGLCWGILIVISFFCIGCGDGLPQRVSVSGRVLIDGKPLEQGVVQVFPKNERMATGEIGPGGKFSLSTFDTNDGCMPGKHPVAIVCYKAISNTKLQWFAPKKYSEATTSGLEIDVPGPRDDVVINLTWAGGKPYIEDLTK
jgi:hypothetical protein